MSFPKNSAFEAAVIADCENDLPRLVYADWLDEHGDPARAAFIRVQIALHDKSPADADYSDLVEARREAFDRVKWRRDLQPKLSAAVSFHDVLYDADDDDLSRSYHRGFPYVIGEPYLGDGWSPAKEANAADRFRAALPQVLATTTARGLSFSTYLSRQLHRILPAAECGRFTAFSANNMPHERGEVPAVEALIGSPLPPSLRWLDLDLHGDADALPLARAELPHLHRWDAHHGFWCSPAALKKLTAAGWFRRLHRLLCPFPRAKAKALWSALAAAPDLHTVQVWCSPDAGGLAPLATAKTFRSLGRLHLHAVDLSPADLAGLVRARLPKLAVFQARCGLRNDGLNELTGADWFGGLRVLEVGGDALGDQGVVALGRTAAAASLRSLALTTPKLGKKAFASIAHDYPRLTTLDLYPSTKVKVTTADMTAFAAALALPHLRHLTLKCWPITDPAAVALANNPSLANLTRLTLGYAGIGAKGVRALLTSPHLQRLVFLDLDDSPGGVGMDALTDPCVLPHLAHCWLPDDVPPKVYAKLRKARGNIFVGGPD